MHTDLGTEKKKIRIKEIKSSETTEVAKTRKVAYIPADILVNINPNSFQLIMTELWTKCQL